MARTSEIILPIMSYLPDLTGIDHKKMLSQNTKIAKHSNRNLLSFLLILLRFFGAHESDKVRKLVRSYLLYGLKFFTGEGRPSNSLKQLSERIAVGKCHDHPDLTRNSYANHLMSKCGVDDKPSLESIGRRTRWWKTYGPQVQKEIRAKRSQINSKLRKNVAQGERSWIFCWRAIGYFNLTL